MKWRLVIPLHMAFNWWSVADEHVVPNLNTDGKLHRAHRDQISVHSFKDSSEFEWFILVNGKRFQTKNKPGNKQQNSRKNKRWSIGPIFFVISLFWISDYTEQAQLDEIANRIYEVWKYSFLVNCPSNLARGTSASLHSLENWEGRLARKMRCKKVVLWKKCYMKWLYFSLLGTPAALERGPIGH